MTQDPAPFSTLAIGSFPFPEPPGALDLMEGRVDIPAAPQLVRLSPWEDMLLGAADGIFFVEADGEARTLSVPAAGREESLARFYEAYYSGDYSFLARSPRASGGWDAFLGRARESPAFGRTHLKTQVVGPLTFGQSVKVEGGFSLVDDPGLLEAASAALGAKIAWEAAAIRGLGRAAVAFLDEPGLSGYGSAFSTLSAETVLGSLNAAAAAARSLGPVLVGLHVCGNTDWGLMTRADIDVLNCDSYGYLESVSLYPRELQAFLERGGRVAWGLVPAQGFEAGTSPGCLAARLAEGLGLLARRGVDPALLASRSLLTTSCGLGSLSEAHAAEAVGLFPRVQEELRGRFL
ncbi:MAG: hypothetical protein LBG06_08385 [Deltaproteobacteria bacterium]|jgi:hypothetical protein|nr:hypothetical protein [Deltaproteobacteria bacterium]